MKKTCKNCGQAAYGRFTKKRRGPCYQYYLEHGEDQPEELWRKRAEKKRVKPPPELQLTERQYLVPGSWHMTLTELDYPGQLQILRDRAGNAVAVDRPNLKPGEINLVLR